MSAPVYVSMAKDIILAIAAIVTATVAIVGLRKWRQELQGRAEFEVARGLIRATYKTRDELGFARSPLVRASEYPDSYPGNGHATPEQESQALAHLYSRRWAPVATALQEFDAQALEGEALWGAEIRPLTQELRQCAHVLHVSMESMIENAASGGQNFEADRAFARLARSEVYASPAARDNALSNRIAAAVGAIEERLKGHLRRV